MDKTDEIRAKLNLAPTTSPDEAHIDELEAEIDRLREETKKTSTTGEMLVAELDRLRAAMELAERCHLEQVTQGRAEIDRLRAELKARTGMTDLDADFYRDKAVIIAERDRLRVAVHERAKERDNWYEECNRLRDENTGLRSQIAEIRRVVDSWRPPKETEG